MNTKLQPNLPANTSIQADMMTEYQMLASILVDEPVLHSENMSSVNYRGKGSNTFSTSVLYEDGFSKVNPQMIIHDSLEYSYLDSLKIKSKEDSQHENLISFNRKLIAHHNKTEDPPNKLLITNTDINCYNQNQSHHDHGILNQDAPESSINFQELNELTYTARYKQ